MSSAYLLLQQPSLRAVQWSQPPPSSSSPNPDSRQSCMQTDLWRPWLSSRDRPESNPCSRPSQPCSRASASSCCSSDGKPQAFQHPVRLFWPKSRSFDYLYSNGEALLRNFPVQATISFYEETDSEDDEDADEEDEKKDWEEGDDTNTKESLKHRSCFTSCS